MRRTYGFADDGLINGVRISQSFEAHHCFPQALFGKDAPYEYIFKDAGININDPRLLTWWDSFGHGVNASAYNQELMDFIRHNSDDVNDVINKVREMMSEYGFKVGF